MSATWDSRLRIRLGRMYIDTRRDDMKLSTTYSKPASPVRLASLVGFSNKHSSPACLQRLHGGFSAPSHLIFCFLQAFYGR